VLLYNGVTLQNRGFGGAVVLFHLGVSNVVV